MKRIIPRLLEALYDRRFAIVVACIAVCAVADGFKGRDYVLPWLGETVSVGPVASKSRHMFVAKLGRPDLGIDGAPEDAVLYEITTRHGVAAFKPMESTACAH